MAVTKILPPVHTRLDRTVHYAINPDKTEQFCYASAINCASTATAYAEMTDTKRRFRKPDGVLGYHFVQSFKPGETTPEQAHRIGVAFAEKCFGDRFEVVVGTHLDQAHLHNHIVINSVSCLDGKKYHSSPASYYNVIRAESDRLCREENLSVIEPKGRGKHYAEWQAEQSGQPTNRDMTRVDIDTAIRQSFTFSDFITQMRRRGYGVNTNPNRKYITIHPPGADRPIRLTEKSMGAAYSEDAIKARIARQRSRQPEQKPAVTFTPKRYRYTGSLRPRQRKKLRGFLALYWHYMYLLGKVKRGTASPKLPASMRGEVRKLERYNRQFLFLYRNNITSSDELTAHKLELEQAVAAHVARRESLYQQRRAATDPDEITAALDQINQALRQCRRDLKLCADIARAVPQIRAQDAQAHDRMVPRQTEREKEKEIREKP